MSNILNSSGVLTVIKKFFHINGSVRDIVVNPTYAIVASTGSIDEGETVTYTFTTTDTDGTYYWVNNGKSKNSSNNKRRACIGCSPSSYRHSQLGFNL